LTSGHRRVGIGRFLAAVFAGWGTDVVSSCGRGPILPPLAIEGYR
jgi:hypothetical protein